MSESKMSPDEKLKLLEQFVRTIIHSVPTLLLQEELMNRANNCVHCRMKTILEGFHYCPVCGAEEKR